MLRASIKGVKRYQSYESSVMDFSRACAHQCLTVSTTDSQSISGSDLTLSPLTVFLPPALVFNGGSSINQAFAALQVPLLRLPLLWTLQYQIYSWLNFTSLSGLHRLPHLVCPPPHPGTFFLAALFYLLHNADNSLLLFILVLTC